ncbi:hypothetical protein JCGZ_19357 [Jatropha curcas]|uniref:Aminotransferase-like plant mobile domain-containing protein n=1 Tax=Jatropha curcas TaxID=180498 RepID=A0A067K040_JATCU|nr:hypothetical protein JCGZ_19357 [Jatropha curcas]
MSQLSEIPASAYTREMETLGALPDIPTFDGEPVSVSRNLLTPGTRPLQLLPSPAREMRGATSWLWDTSVLRATYFKQLRDAAVGWHSASAEVNLGKARSGGSATDASAFWDLLDPPMRARVVAAGFRDYAAGLRRTQPRFPPAMRYALMERWNDCTHTFVFGFGEMTFTLCCYYWPALHWPGSPTGCSVSDGHSRGPASLFLARCHYSDPVHRLGVHVLRDGLLALGREDQDPVGGLEGVAGGGPTCMKDKGTCFTTRHSTMIKLSYASGEDPEYWQSLLNDRELSDVSTRKAN